MATDHRLIEYNLEQIRRSYGVPVKIGGRVTYTGGAEPKQGTILGVENGRLRIRLDGEKLSGIYHPTWELTYEKEIVHA